MKYIFLLLLTLIMPLTACSKEEQKATSTTPALEFTETDIDIGTVTSLMKVPVTYTVKNISESQTVGIEKIITGCGCTTSSDYPGEIKPGQEISFTLSFDPGWREGDYKRDIRFVTNDPAQNTYKLAFHGNIYPLLRWEPREANFGELQNGEDHRMGVDLILEDVEDPVITEAYPVQDSRVKYELIDVIDYENGEHRGKKYRFDVIIEKDFPVGKFVTKTGLKTEKPLLLPSLTVHGEIMSDVVFEPKRAYCRLKVGEVRDELITLESVSKTPFQVTDITQDKPMPVELTVEEGETLFQKVLRCRFSASQGVDSGTGRAKLTVETETSEKPVILEIPIMMVVRPK